MRSHMGEFYGTTRACYYAILALPHTICERWCTFVVGAGRSSVGRDKGKG
jgi:hypothetical protein